MAASAPGLPTAGRGPWREPPGERAQDAAGTVTRAGRPLPLASARTAPLSVLVVTAMYPHAEQPGNGAFVMHQVEQLRAFGHHVDIVHVKGYRSRWNYMLGALAVFRATWRGAYDIVHVHYGLSGLSALVRWRTPLVVTLHGSDVLQTRLQRLVSRVVSAGAAATIVVSPAVGERVAGTVIPCGVDLNTFRPMERGRARQALGLAPSRRYVLFPFDPERRLKRWDLARSAVDLLRARGLDAELLTVWRAPNAEMPLYYSAADVMVLCSDSEGSPTSVKEALACNLPVVSTRVGDVDVLLEGVAGAEICEQTPTSLAAALARAIETAERVTFEGRAAMQRYDQGATVQALLRVYHGVLRRLPPADVA